MTQTLPPLQDRWITDLLGVSLDGEARSTCFSCAMVAGPAPDPGPHFRADVKCCMFVPTLPNFTVGRILLDDESPAGQASVRARIAQGAGCTPMGLKITPEAAAEHDAARKDGQYGLRRDLLCPHWLDERGGICSIWRHREAVCSTWFCHHSRGAVSAQVWLTLRKLLQTLENALARWALLQLHPGRTDLGWGDYADRREALYIACARAVESLSWKQVRKIGGLEVQMRAQMLREAHHELVHPSVPPEVNPGPRTVEELPDGKLRVWTWSRYDPLDLPRELLELLPGFAGRPTEDVMAELGAAGLMDEVLLLQLADWRLLSMPPDEGPLAG